MNISDITELIWKSCEEIPFGNTKKWNNNTFKEVWFTQNNIYDKWDSGSPGWYWFICDISYIALHNIARPDSLPKLGCDFGLVSRENLDTFSEEKLCSLDNDEVVVYNGHEGNIMSRIRTHFSLKNNSTGALGINHYPFSDHKWKVKIFTQRMIVNLPTDIQEQVRKLLNNKTGRCSIESAWRVRNGWPILCKE